MDKKKHNFKGPLTNHIQKKESSSKLSNPNWKDHVFSIWKKYLQGYNCQTPLPYPTQPRPFDRGAKVWPTSQASVVHVHSVQTWKIAKAIPS